MRIRGVSHWQEIMWDEILKSKIEDLRKMNMECIWKTAMLYKTIIDTMAWRMVMIKDIFTNILLWWRIGEITINNTIEN